MDFDDAKENIQPLAAGRNASILQAALHAESHHELQQQRRQYEEAIMNYDGEDPLEPWYEYIYWIEQSFPSGGKESGLEEVLLKCLTKFEKDERYHQDRRMIKLYIKYIDTHENPQECYQQLFNQGIGTMVADLYICWAYYYDVSGNFRKADQIFRRGIECRAQPLEELQEAHQHFGFTMSQRILYDDDTSKQKYQSSMQEKRQALTSLRSHRKKVGSIRTGAAIKSFAPGTVKTSASSNRSQCANSNVPVYEDENQDPNIIPSIDPTPETSKSVVRTLLDSARKQENVKEPGPWNRAHDKKKGKLFASDHRTELGFEILEDDEVIPINGKINIEKPFIYLEGFVARNERQEEWILPVTLENDLIPRSYPSYDKCSLYPQPNMEFSPEELRGYHWCKRNNIENNFTKKYDVFWSPSVETGVRMYPNFAKKNQIIEEERQARNFDPSEVNVSGKIKLVFDPKLCYPSEEEEHQFEEVMYHRWKCGDRKLKYGGNETIAFTEEMEETICLPHEAPRRKSFFPTRKSIAPSQFHKLNPNIKDDEESENEKQDALPSRRSVIMKTPKKKQAPDTEQKIQIYEDTVDENEFEFKAPTVPPGGKQQKLNFQIYEEEENNYEANETCSTQVFNCFLKAQSVSTPKAPANALKPCLVERPATSLNFSEIENVPPAIPVPNPAVALSPPEYNDVGLTLHGKQLSTIMETSEQATGNTASTKSSISSPDFETDGQPSRLPLTNNICTLETVQEAGSLAEKDSGEILLMKSLRLQEEPIVRQHNEISRLEQREDTVPTMPIVKIFEDKTETIPKIIFAKAGNFSRLEDRDDTTPIIKPVKFHEDKTETITKMVLVPKRSLTSDIPPDEEMLELFAKTPEKGPRLAATTNNIFSPPPQAPPAANKSIFTASAFMNFQDSPETKMKCNYDSPILKAKLSSLAGAKKSSDLSFLPNISTALNEECNKSRKLSEKSFLPDLSATFDEFKRQTSSNRADVQFCVTQPQPKDISFLSEFEKEPHDSQQKNKTIDPSLMLDFPSSPKARTSVSKHHISLINKITSVENKEDDNSRIAGDCSRKNIDSLPNGSKCPEVSFLPNLSTATTHKADISAALNIIRTSGELAPKRLSQTSKPSKIPLHSIPGTTRISFLNKQKDVSAEKLQDQEKTKQTSRVTFFEQEKTELQKSLIKSNSCDQELLFKRPTSASQTSQSNSMLSFLNTMNTTDNKSPPAAEAQHFSIFEDSNCQKQNPDTKPMAKFTIFEDSNCRDRKSVAKSNKNTCFDISLKPDDFFEENIRTETFATNLSMIRNSTWLPNHDPNQPQIKEQSIHIKEEMDISSATEREKARGLSIFSSVPHVQEKSIDLMPPPPMPSIKKPPPNDCIEIAESDDDSNTEDLGRSIYYTKTPKTPKITRHVWSPEPNKESPENNIFVHRQVDLDHTQQVIDDYCVAANVNPFNRELLDAFLYQIDFTNYIEKLPNCEMVCRVKPLKKDCTITINGTPLNVLKLIGEGSYGSVYCAKEPQSGRLFALKQERPANLWEYYICLELRSRLHSDEILSGFMNVECALIGNNAGILVSNFSRYGSLITVCNKIKKETMKNVDEYVVMHMASQLLLIIDHLHASNIIHADIKPDNFLLMDKLVPGKKQPTIQLIDFGNSIDMDLFKKGQTFTYVHETESFKCVEMHEKRPWTYQLDLFGLAGVIHVLLFGKYMDIVKKPSGWSHKTHVPRYFNRPLWETIFHTLLNIDNCQTMPNLQDLRAQLEEEIAEKDKAVCQKIVEFNQVLDM